MRNLKQKARLYHIGDRIKCKNIRELRNLAFLLSTDGYGVAVQGYADLLDNVLTVTALPLN